MLLDAERITQERLESPLIPDPVVQDAQSSAQVLSDNLGHLRLARAGLIVRAGKQPQPPVPIPGLFPDPDEHRMRGDARIAEVDPDLVAPDPLVATLTDHPEHR